MTRTRRHDRKRDRRGYALASVMIFLGVMLTFIAIGQRQLSSALRLERARAEAEFRDEGALQALAQGLRLLETGLPPSDPYVCRTDITTSRGVLTFDVNFSSDGLNNWTVTVAPGSTFTPDMPASFAD